MITARVTTLYRDKVTGWYRYVLSCGHHYYARSGEWPRTSWATPLEIERRRKVAA